MVSLNLFLKYTRLAGLLFSFCGFSATATVKGICTRVEGQKLICGSGGGPRCSATSCSQYAASYYTCDSFQLCNGQTCQGSKTEDPCPPASSYSMCDTPPSRYCTTCPQGTAAPNITCTGTCYDPVYTSSNYKALTGGGGMYCTDPGTVETCTITEAGRVCTTQNVCNAYGTYPRTCETNSMSCITSYTSTPNVPVGCACKCGPTGMPAPSVPACSVPADTCT